MTLTKELGHGPEKAANVKMAGLAVGAPPIDLATGRARAAQSATNADRVMFG